MSAPVSKAMILAAGRGERLRPLTDSTPKPLIEVAGRSLIEYHLDNLAVAGIRDIVINTAWLAEQIHQRLGDGSRYGVKIVYSDEGTALETAGGIQHALPLLGDAPFLVINGDIWTDYDLRRLPTLKSQSLAHLVLVKNPVHNVEGDFAILDGWLQNEGRPRFTFSGIGLYHPQLFDKLAPGAAPLGPLLRNGARQRKISAEIFHGHWTDVGSPERLQQLRELLEQAM